MKKFWLLMFCFILLVSLGCQPKETTSHENISDDSEESVTDASEDEDEKSELKKQKKDHKDRTSSEALDEADSDPGEALDEADFDSGEEIDESSSNLISDLESFFYPRPKKIEVPPYDPRDIAANAMKLYDSNGDEKLDEEELEACPAMLYSLKCPKSIDTNADGVIDKNEIQARIQGWIDMKVGLTCPIVKFVNERGKVAKNVIGEKVILTPDPVHEGILKATVAVEIDMNGECCPTTLGNIDGLIGMPYGFYTVTIEGTPYQNLGVEIYDGAKDEESYSFNVEVKK